MLTKILRLALSSVMLVYALGLIAYLVLRVTLADRFWWLAFANNFAPFYFVPLVILLVLGLLFRINVRLSLVTAILLVIGAAWFAPRFIPHSVAHAGTDTIKVITFNVWGGNQRLEDVAAWLREQNADVVLMQEMPPELPSIALAQLDDLYPNQFHTTDWGQMALSRFPVVEEEAIDLEGDGTGTHQRFVIDVDGTQIAVYNIHTHMPTRDTPRFRLPINHFSIELFASYDETARNTQIRNLFDKLEHEPLPYIVSGDFNTSDNSIMYGTMVSLMHDSFREAATGLGGSWPVGARAGLPDWVPPLIRIDYVWHSDDFDAMSAATGPVLGSDHIPVIVTLALDSE